VFFIRGSVNRENRIISFRPGFMPFADIRFHSYF